MVKDFKFKDPASQHIADRMKKAMAGLMNVPESEIKCKGIRFYFVHEPTEVMMSEGFFVDKFNPEEYLEDD